MGAASNPQSFGAGIRPAATRGGLDDGKRRACVDREKSHKGGPPTVTIIISCSKAAPPPRDLAICREAARLSCLRCISVLLPGRSIERGGSGSGRGGVAAGRCAGSRWSAVQRLRCRSAHFPQGRKEITAAGGSKRRVGGSGRSLVGVVPCNRSGREGSTLHCKHATSLHGCG